MNALGSRLAEAWTRLMARSEPDSDTDRIAEAAVAQAPVVWLLGKVQAGKSSIVQAVTGSTRIEVGSGFKACTRTAEAFDFPAEAPLVRFLDTRGLGEAGYDPQDDIAACMRQAHLLLAVMRARDPQQDAIIDVVAQARRRHPGWPVLVAQTCLHDAYPPGGGHIMPYPFAAGLASGDARLPPDLLRGLAHQRTLFDRVGGNGPLAFVPLDFTQPGDGLEPRLYGFEELLAAIAEVAPASLAATLGELRAAGADRTARKAHPRILGYAAVAAAVDVVPIAGIVAVPGVQAKLLHSLADLYGVPWDRRTLTAFGGCLGAGVLARLLATFGIREAAKLVPVYGQTAGAAAAAAASFSTTYALGQAASYFLARAQRGESDPAGVAAAYKQALATALQLARDRGLGEGRQNERT